MHDRLEELWDMRPDKPAAKRKPSKQEFRDFNWCHTLGTKLYSVVDTLATSRVLGIDGHWENTDLAQVLTNTDMCEYYRGKLGQIELVRDNGALESFYFTMPQLFVKSDKFIRQRIDQIMENCSLDNHVQKLHQFQEGVLELSVEVLAAEAAARADESTSVKIFLANFDNKRAFIQSFLTVLVNAIVVSAFVPGSCSLCGDTYARVPWMYWVFLCIAPLHGLAATMGFCSWMITRAPVMLYRAKRRKDIEDSRDVDGEEGDPDHFAPLADLEEHALAVVRPTTRWLQIANLEPFCCAPAPP